ILEAVRRERSLVDRVARKDRNTATHVVERGLKQRLGSGLRLRAHMIFPPSLSNRKCRLSRCFGVSVGCSRRRTMASTKIMMHRGELMLFTSQEQRDFEIADLVLLRAHVIFPPSLWNMLRKYWCCFGVGSRPYTVRAAMSSMNS